MERKIVLMSLYDFFPYFSSSKSSDPDMKRFIVKTKMPYFINESYDGFVILDDIKLDNTFSIIDIPYITQLQFHYYLFGNDLQFYTTHTKYIWSKFFENPYDLGNFFNVCGFVVLYKSLDT